MTCANSILKPYIAIGSLDDISQFDLKTMAIFRILDDMCQLDPKTMAIR